MVDQEVVIQVVEVLHIEEVLREAAEDLPEVAEAQEDFNKKI